MSPTVYDGPGGQHKTQSQQSVLKSLPKLVGADYPNSSTATMIPRQHRSGVLGKTAAGGPPPQPPPPGTAAGSSSGNPPSDGVLSSQTLNSKLTGDPTSRLINLSSPKPAAGANKTSSSVINSKGVVVGSASLKQASGQVTAPSITLGKGTPPPIPPNKPAMSALYKPLTAALKLGGGATDNGVSTISGDQQK